MADAGPFADDEFDVFFGLCLVRAVGPAIGFTRRRVDAVAKDTVRFLDLGRRYERAAFAWQEIVVRAQVQVAGLAAAGGLHVEDVDYRCAHAPQGLARTFEAFGLQDGIQVFGEQFQKRGPVHGRLVKRGFREEPGH